MSQEEETAVVLDDENIAFANLVKEDIEEDLYNSQIKVLLEEEETARGEGAGRFAQLKPHLTGDEPEAWSILTYGQTIDTTSELYSQQTIRFSEKDWREVLLTPEQIGADPDATTRVVSQP